MSEIDKHLLKPNSITPQIYGEFSFTNDDDRMLYVSIVNVGILERLKVTRDNIVISGNRRLQCAMLIDGIQQVQVEYIDIEEENIDEYLVVNYNQQRVKDNIQVAIEYDIISKKYKSVSGRKNEECLEVRNELLKANNISDSTIQRIRRSKKILMDDYGYSKDEAWDELREMTKGKTSINHVLDMLLEAKAEKQNDKKAKGMPLYNDNNIQIMHGDSSKHIKSIPDGSIDNCTTSPPYFSMKIYSEDGKVNKTIGRKGEEKTKQSGQEQSVDDYINKLMNVFNECKSKMKDSSSIFINVMDAHIDGLPQRIPDKIINAFTKKGDIVFNQYIYWYKRNPVYQSNGAKRFQPSLEYILHFVIDPKKFKWRRNWFGKGDKFLASLTYGSEKKERVFRNMIIYPEMTEESFEVGKAAGAIQTNVINNSKLAKLLKEKGFKLQHNALYPLEVPMMCILSTTDKGDTILDPYNGLGTTGIIAYVNECKYLGIDISKVYAVKSSIRIEDFVKNYSKYKLNNKNEIDF